MDAEQVAHWWEDGPSLAYVVAEQARLLCETLIAEASHPFEHHELRSAHAALGSAGYLASDGFAPETRCALLELVHEHGPVVTPPAGDAVEQVYVLALHLRALAARGARRAAEAAVMEIVHRHARQALAAIAHLLPEQRPAQLSTKARHEGYLAEAWQREWLVPVPRPARALAS